MLQVAVAGAAGRMGKELLAAIALAGDLHLALALVRGDVLTGANFDVLVDFSSIAGVSEHVRACAEYVRPMVVGVTGLTQDQLQLLEQASKEIPIVHAPNTSIGINVLHAMAGYCGRVLDSQWQVAIHDVHHRHKKDAPSGTSLYLAEAVAAARGLSQPCGMASWDSGEGCAAVDTCASSVGDSSSGHAARSRLEDIQFNSVRAGDVVGEHTVSFINSGERIEITHKVTDRAIFARGALAAARWVATQPPGLYSMRDVVESLY